MGVCFCTGACRILGRCPNTIRPLTPFPRPTIPAPAPTITPMPAPVGWTCPACGVGVAPWAASCPNCAKPTITITHSNTTKSDADYQRDRCLSQCGPDFCTGFCQE